MTRGAALILAAGRSQRMGRPKAELPFLEGTFLSTIWSRLPWDELEWAAIVVAPEEGSRAAQDGLVGLAPVDPATTEPAQAPPMRRLVNPHPEQGQLSSLRVGLEGGAAKSPWTLVALVDQPGVAALTYRRLARAASLGGAHLWVPRQAGRRGHPVVWSSHCYPDLLQGPLQEGSRRVVARHRHLRVELEVEDPEIHRDVDTPADYERLREEAGP